MPTNPPTLQIVTLSPDDWQAYRALRLEALRDAPQAFGSTYAGMLEKSADFWRARLESAARGENSWLLFARAGQALVGMIGAVLDEPEPGQALDPAAPKSAAVISVYVTPAARGTGAANLLMQAILDLLTAQGVQRAYLGVNAEQHAAVRLYRRFGFTVYETVHTPMGDGREYDEYFMERRLD